MGVETNGMQYYPEASKVEATIHPGLYRRVAGQLDWSTVEGRDLGIASNRYHESSRNPRGALAETIEPHRQERV